MPSISYRVVAMPNLKAALDKFGDDKFGKAMGKAARETERIAKRLAPPPSQPQAKVQHPTGGGILKGSIESAAVQGGRGKDWKVFTNKPYAKFVEYGTGRRGAASKQPDPGVDPEYVHGSTAGMGAQPFLRPAVNFTREKLRKGGFIK